MILVIGGTGLVGSHLLVKLLQESKKIRAIYRKEKNLEAVKKVFSYYNKANWFEKINWVKADINDIPSLELAFQNITQVYHCAALISFDPRDQKQLFKINIEGTANVVNCCLDLKISKLCYVSSVAALGDTTGNEKIITEETEWNPEVLHHAYAISKYAAEMEVWRGFKEGLQVVIVNPAVIFGYGFPNKNSSAVVQSLKKGNPFYTKGKFGIVAVEDVVSIMHQLMNSNINGERFAVVAENRSFEDVLNIISDILKLKRPFIYANPVITSIAWRFDWFLSAILQKKRVITKATALASHTDKVFDNTKIKDTLNFKFINMKDYLQKLIPSF